MAVNIGKYPATKYRLVFDNALFVSGAEKSVNLTVKNTGSEAVVLRQIEALHSCPSVILSDFYNVTQGTRFVRILSGQSIYAYPF